MCPSCNSDASSASTDHADMVGVENSRVGRPAQSNGVNGHTNGVNGHANGQPNGTTNGTISSPNQRVNPYAPRASDFLNNVRNFNIIESTLRGD